MELMIVSIRDIVADVYLPPQFANNLGGAIRSFGDACKDPQSPLNKHPEDYELYHLGNYHDADATFKLLDKPKQISIGKNYKD